MCLLLFLLNDYDYYDSLSRGQPALVGELQSRFTFLYSSHSNKKSWNVFLLAPLRLDITMMANEMAIWIDKWNEKLMNNE